MADDDFSTGAELEISVSDSSLSDARDTIESELGDIEVDVNAVVSGNQTQPRDPGSGQFMAMEGVEQRVVNTNDTLDSLIQIENERWELDKIRNDYLEQLAEGGALPQRGQGGGGGDTTIIGGTSALGKLGGTAALSGLGKGLGGMSILSLLTVGDKAAPDEKFRFQERDSPSQRLLRAAGIDTSKKPKQRRQDIKGSIPELEWPDLPDLSTEVDWPTLPDLSQDFDWPDPPEFDLNPFDDQQGGGGQRRNVAPDGMVMTGPGSGQQTSVEPTINLGGITVDVTTTIDDAVDDAVTEVEDTVEREVGQLEDRVADAIGGFFG